MGGQIARAIPPAQLGRAGQVKRAKQLAPLQRFLSEANEDNTLRNKI